MAILTMLLVVLVWQFAVGAIVLLLLLLWVRIRRAVRARRTARDVMNYPLPQTATAE